MRRHFFILAVLLSAYAAAQRKPADTLYLMNGRILVTPVLDTLLGAVTFVNPDDSTKREHIDNEQLFAVRYHTGAISYYYEQDTISNWFTREEMWYFMQGERDARKGFKPWGSFYGTMACGMLGGVTGQFWGPLLPATYMAGVGLPWVRIRHNTVSDIRFLDQDSYILGYEREARRKRRVYALIGSAIGMALGYATYFVWLQHEPTYPF